MSFFFLIFSHRNNQNQIVEINDYLTDKGLNIYTDDILKPYTPELRTEIQKNIDHANAIVVFVTLKFMSKVNGMDGNNDICKIEYEYALKTAASKMVIVILEARMKDPSVWKGQLR